MAKRVGEETTVENIWTSERARKEKEKFLLCDVKIIKRTMGGACWTNKKM
jgi:hypothetical protein